QKHALDDVIGAADRRIEQIPQQHIDDRDHHQHDQSAAGEPQLGALQPLDQTDEVRLPDHSTDGYFRYSAMKALAGLPCFSSRSTSSSICFLASSLSLAMS